MKWLEIIQIRTSEKKSEQLITELSEVFAEAQEADPGLVITLFRHSHLTSDFSLHLYHQSETTPPGKSQIGQILGSAIKEHGLVNHTTWMLEATIKKEQRQKNRT